MTKARILADLLSDNAELADGQISVAEVVGAAPLANPTFTGDVTAPEIDLSAISATIADTAVDVFVYDTSKDSDGGAWRHRTQHTSWYNEAASATRGSRKEFPAVAVIVTESSTVTIYDGDDPDLPMWMVFNGSNRTDMIYGLSDNSQKATKMLNGLLVSVGNDSGGQGGTFPISFITDNGYFLSDASSSPYKYRGNIEQRNDALNISVGDSGNYGVVVSRYVNDVAMTVLPNSPIDAATGLPVPTIGIATNGGVSVIKDDGTVVDITISGNATYNVMHNVKLSGNDVIFSNANASQNFPYVRVVPIPSADIAYYFTGSGVTEPLYYIGTEAGWVDSLTLVGVDSTSSIKGIEADGDFRAIGATGGLNLISENRTTPAQGSVAYIASDYNTGHMVGDIKLATLSDTDDTNVTGAELVTNGTFASNSDWSLNTGWSISGGKLRKSDNSNNSAIQTITTVVGKTYTISVTVDTGASGSYLYAVSSYTGDNMASAGQYSRTFTAVSTSTQVGITCIPGNGLIADNFSVRLAEEDRSVNGNGLQVFGTVTKNPVATGADLVAYGPFTNANYLAQPYNSDLNFGTGDFCIMGWFKLDSSSGSSRIAYRQEDNTNRWSLYSNSSELWFYQTDGTALYAQMSGTHTLGNWHHVVVRRSNTLTDFALDGKIRANTSGYPGTAGARDATFNGELYLGRDPNESSGSTNSWNGSLALMRISATIPSPEQIAKIYNDEKHLFQENAQATLYGSSDAVTALAYDDNTDLLHVGTSAGRSVFQGLRRVDNTTDAVGAAISASNGLVAED